MKQSNPLARRRLLLLGALVLTGCSATATTTNTDNLDRDTPAAQTTAPTVEESDVDTAAASVESDEQGTPDTSAIPSTSISAAPIESGYAVGCPQYAQAVVGDFDGDGLTDQATIRGSTLDDRRVEICNGSGGTVDLPIVATDRYLAALDVQGDGRTELLIGTPTRVDDVESRNIDARLFAWPESQPVAVQIDGAPLRFPIGIEYSEAGVTRHGVGCLDLEGTDGRQLLLVESQIDIEKGDGDELPWNRTVLAISGATATTVRQDSGVFTLGVDDESIALIQRVSCGFDLIDFELFTPPPSLCDSSDDSASGGATEGTADLDGDGLRDQLYQVDVAGVPYIGVCSGMRQHDWIEVLPGDITVFDLDRDGVPEVLNTRASDGARYTRPFRLLEDRLVPLDAGFVDGRAPLDLGDQAVPAHWQWSCTDVAGNRLSELTQLQVWIGKGDDAEAAAYRWRSTTYRLTTTGKEQVAVDSGRLVAPALSFADLVPTNAEPLLSDDAIIEADSIAPPCLVG